MNLTACAITLMMVFATAIVLLEIRRRSLNSEIISGYIKDILILTHRGFTEYAIVVVIKGAKAEFNFRFTEHEFFCILSQSRAVEVNDMIGMVCLLVLRGKRARFLEIIKGANWTSGRV